MYEITSATFTPENFLAGGFPVVTDVGPLKSGATIHKYAPLAQGADGIEEAAAATLDELIGIAADEPGETKIIYYLTGEFFAKAIYLPSGVTIEALKPALRKLGIFLKEEKQNG